MRKINLIKRITLIIPKRALMQGAKGKGLMSDVFTIRIDFKFNLWRCLLETLNLFEDKGIPLTKIAV
jgi:hypothetical protein